jgi:biotin carboxyl carrier protein
MQEKELANAQAALKWWEDVDGKQMITNAELGTRTAKAGVDDQQDELDQLKKMYKSEELTNATADIVVKRALRNLEIGKVTQSMAEQRETKTKQFDYDRERIKFVFAIEQQTSTLNQLKATQAQAKVTRKTALDSAKAGLEKAQKKLDDLKADLEALSVKAPFDGVVYYGQLSAGAWQNSGPKALRVGDKLTANQFVMTIAAPGKLRAIADIPNRAFSGRKPARRRASSPQQSRSNHRRNLRQDRSRRHAARQRPGFPASRGACQGRSAPGARRKSQRADRFS